MALEREHQSPLAKEGFDPAAVRFPVVNASGCVKALTNFYETQGASGHAVPVYQFRGLRHFHRRLSNA